MIEKLVTRFVDFQAGIGTIKEDDVNVYQYGYTLMVEVILNMALSLILGVLLGQIKKVIFFLCMFIPLRSFCGGYHANKIWKCVILSNFIIIVPIFAVEKLILYKTPQCLLMMLCGIVITLFAPSESFGKKLSMHEKKVYKFGALIFFFVESIIGFILLCTGKVEYYYIVLISHVIQALSLLLNFTPKKYKDC